MKANLKVSALLALSVSSMCGQSVFASDTFTYDLLGRLTTAQYETGICIAYFYDANGNRTAITTVATAPETPVWGSAHWGCFDWSP